MAGAMFHTQHSLGYSGSGDETVLQVQSPTNQRVRIRKIRIGPLGSTGAVPPVQLELTKQTTQGTGGGAGTALKCPSPPVGFSAQSTVLTGTSFSAQPTDGVSIEKFNTHPQTATIWVPDHPVYMDNGEAIGLKVVGGPAVTVDVDLFWEE